MKRTVIITIIVIGVIILRLRPEITIGYCYNVNQDGRLLFSTMYEIEPPYNYISYRSTSYGTGDYIYTLFLYNPFNNAKDDIILRHDWR